MNNLSRINKVDNNMGLHTWTQPPEPPYQQVYRCRTGSVPGRTGGAPQDPKKYFRDKNKA